MSQKVKKYTCWSIQFGFGGAAYGFLEILWRGYTHFSMLIAGGVCFWFLIRIAKSKKLLPIKIPLGGFCITAVEFLTGCVVNLWLAMDVWDYSGEPFQLLGQICIRYILLWTSLCSVIIPVCRKSIELGKSFQVPILRRFRAHSFRSDEALTSFTQGRQ